MTPHTAGKLTCAPIYGGDSWKLLDQDGNRVAECLSEPDAREMVKRWNVTPEPDPPAVEPWNKRAPATAKGD